MVSLDEAVIARLRREGENFEVLVDPQVAADLIDGKDVDIMPNLAIDAVFSDAKKGKHASEGSLQKHFDSTDIEEIAQKIILKGDIQLTTQQRHKLQEKKWNKIVDTITRNAMNPQSKAPHPRQRIERAMEEAGVHVDPFKSVNQQVKEALEAIKPILPISMEQIEMSVKIPPQYAGKAYGIARGFGSLVREDWQSDGSWVGVIKIPAGMQSKFYDKLNEVTKGNIDTKILK